MAVAGRTAGAAARAMAAAPPTVAFQGQPGAFSEDATEAYFAAPRTLAVPTWRAVFEAVRDGMADAAVVAIESSVGGSIRETYDLLAEFDLPIVGAVNVPVRLALVALPGERLETIERVASHPQALAQAEAFLRGRSWQVVPVENTAAAARAIAEGGQRGTAAVAAPRAAALYGLEILATDLQGGLDNRTRFAVLTRPDTPLPAAWLRQPPDPAARRMTTLLFAVRNVPGSLHACLGVFAARGINLSRIESRPARTARWEYVFWIDLDTAIDAPAAAEALAELRRTAAMARVLGSYPRPADD